MPERKATSIFSVSLPKGLAEFAREKAEQEGLSFSALIKVSLAKYTGYKGSIFVQNGGDHASSKSAETHARVCEKMREAKARKRKGLREEGVYAEAERRRRKASSNGKRRDVA